MTALAPSRFRSDNGLSRHSAGTIRRDAATQGNCHESAETRGRDRRDAAVHRQGIPRKPARRPRGLYLRRAGRRRHHASGVPQCRAHDRAALRRAARPQAEGRADLPDRHRRGHLHPQVLPRRAFARGPDRPARRHRALGAAVLRLDGALAGLQGLADERARRQCAVLRAVRRQRQELVRARAEPRAVHEPRHRQSAGRPHEGGRPGQGRVHHHPEGDRRRHLRVGRQGGGDLVGDHALQFPGPERARCRSTTPISRSCSSRR